MDIPWKCMGCTHEYWDGAEAEPLTEAWIDDRGDGGCKSDKFERDERLLRQGLLDEPGNPRYLFYLAQTLHCQGRDREALEFYEARIKAGGWVEECWYSAFMLARCHLNLGDRVESERWALRAYEMDPKRAENLLLLTKAFRESGDNHKAWHYWSLGSRIEMPTGRLFLEKDAYESGFGYERTILEYYMSSDRSKAAWHLLEHYNRWGEGYENLHWYVEKAPSQSRALLLPQIGEFKPSSVSFLPTSTGFDLNVRYVNYTLKEGRYEFEEAVKTDNYSATADEDFHILKLQKKEVAPPRVPNCSVRGLEDLRMFHCISGVVFLAASADYADGSVQQILGSYGGVLEGEMRNRPSNAPCEKNWLPLPGG